MDLSVSSLFILLPFWNFNGRMKEKLSRRNLVHRVER